ncbi:DUF1877 domain-containing protein [Streptomyces sp. NPDC005302]|uniref:DUF1877 domain-containing protein n=1 Tax=Streptomyces sp. NPDC005302 TaxID=3154675 RepID=UPI0033BCE212
MALTQQLARVPLHYLDRCREASTSSPDGDPLWNPPEDDTLDLDGAIWELLRFCRQMRPGHPGIGILERSIDGDAEAPVAFLDHIEFYDGFGGPPALLDPSAVTEVARGLAGLHIDPLLTTLPAYRAAGGLEGFGGDPASYFTEGLARLRSFYRVAGRRGWAVVVWVD